MQANSSRSSRTIEECSKAGARISRNARRAAHGGILVGRTKVMRGRNKSGRRLRLGKPHPLLPDASLIQSRGTPSMLLGFEPRRSTTQRSILWVEARAVSSRASSHHDAAQLRRGHRASWLAWHPSSPDPPPYRSPATPGALPRNDRLAISPAPHNSASYRSGVLRRDIGPEKRGRHLLVPMCLSNPFCCHTARSTNGICLVRWLATRLLGHAYQGSQVVLAVARFYLDYPK